MCGMPGLIGGVLPTPHRLPTTFRPPLGRTPRGLATDVIRTLGRLTVAVRVGCEGGLRAMGRHRRRTAARRHLASVTTGAAAVALPSVIPFAPEQDGSIPSSWSPVAMVSTVERHELPAPSPAAMDGVVPAVAARAESHDPDEVRSLDKAARLADEIATLAAARARATAQGATAASVARDGKVYASPTTGRLTSAAGPRWGTTHYGLDIANRIGTPIFAVADGTVLEAGPASGFGLWVRIRHSDGTISVYGHIDRSLVRTGQPVRAGDRIALMGNRGQSTGPHLHLEIWSASGAKVDPQSWLTRRGIPVR